MAKIRRCFELVSLFLATLIATALIKLSTNRKKDFRQLFFFETINCVICFVNLMLKFTTIRIDNRKIKSIYSSLSVFQGLNTSLIFIFYLFDKLKIYKFFISKDSVVNNILHDYESNNIDILSQIAFYILPLFITIIDFFFIDYFHLNFRIVATIFFEITYFYSGVLISKISKDFKYYNFVDHMKFYHLLYAPFVYIIVWSVLWLGAVNLLVSVFKLRYNKII